MASRAVTDSAEARRARAPGARRPAGGWVIARASCGEFLEGPREGGGRSKIGTCSYGTTATGGTPARRAVRVREGEAYASRATAKSRRPADRTPVTVTPMKRAQPFPSLTTTPESVPAR
ncbi:hypothetical protein GCM10010320_23520 [Streptomyces caelestis]|nr:hypothetical protein GCM10010320_23520 [Streptomyces caelestis]